MTISPIHTTTRLGVPIWAPHWFGCLIPEHLVVALLQQQRELEPQGWRQSGNRASERLLKLSRRRLELIPKECFMPGQFEDALAAIAPREAEAQRMQEYLASMDPELRQARADVLQQHPGVGNEESLMLAANARLTRKREQGR